MLWLESLGTDDDFIVPVPLRTRQGKLVTTTSVVGVPEPRHAAIFSWVPGRDLYHGMQVGRYETLGETTARLHQQALAFAPEPALQLADMSTLFLPGHLDVLSSTTLPEGIAADMDVLLVDVRSRVQAVLDRIYQSASQPARIIHADLHQANVRFQRSKIALLDFDDCLLGHPVQDLAITLYYCLGHPDFEAFRAALQRGYERIAEWPEKKTGDVDALMAWRALALLNFIAQSENPAIRDILPQFSARAGERFKTWLAQID